MSNTTLKDPHQTAADETWRAFSADFRALQGDEKPASFQNQQTNKPQTNN